VFLCPVGEEQEMPELAPARIFPLSSRMTLSRPQLKDNSKIDRTRDNPAVCGGSAQDNDKPDRYWPQSNAEK
jgi:hypothetical protein